MYEMSWLNSVGALLIVVTHVAIHVVFNTCREILTPLLEARSQ